MVQNKSSIEMLNNDELTVELNNAKIALDSTTEQYKNCSYSKNIGFMKGLFNFYNDPQLQSYSRETVSEAMKMTIDNKCRVLISGYETKYNEFKDLEAEIYSRSDQKNPMYFSKYDPSTLRITSEGQMVITPQDVSSFINQNTIKNQ